MQAICRISAIAAVFVALVGISTPAFAERGRDIVKGSADQTTYIRIIDSGDGTPETGVVAATSGLDLEYVRLGAAPADLTESDLAAADSAHSDGGIFHVGGGMYRVDVPDAAAATGVNGFSVQGTVTGMVVLGVTHQLTDVNPYDAVRGGMASLPNANADAAGGLVISDAGGLDLDNRTPAATAVTNINTVYNTDFATNYDATNDKWSTLLGESQGSITFADLNVTANVALADGLTITRSTSNQPGMSVTGNGTGSGAVISSGSGATGYGLQIVSLATNGAGIVSFASGSGSGLLLQGGITGNGLSAIGGETSGNGAIFYCEADHALVVTSDGTNKDGIVATSGGGTGVDIRGDITGNLTGSVSGGVTLADGAITGPKFDGTTAYPWLGTDRTLLTDAKNNSETLIGRLSIARSGYLDKLNITGSVAGAAPLAALQADATLIKTQTDKLSTSLISDGSGGYQYSANALELGPAGDNPDVLAAIDLALKKTEFDTVLDGAPTAQDAVQDAMDAQGYTAARAPALDNASAQVRSSGTVTVTDTTHYVLSAGPNVTGSFVGYTLVIDDVSNPGMSDSVTITAYDGPSATATVDEAPIFTAITTDTYRVMLPTGGEATVDEGVIASAVRTELATELARIDADVSSRASQTSVDDVPTAAENRTEMDSNSTDLNSAVTQSTTAATESTGANAKAADVQGRLPAALVGGKMDAIADVTLAPEDVVAIGVEAGEAAAAAVNDSQTISPINVDRRLTWRFTHSQQTTAVNYIVETVDFDGDLAMDFTEALGGAPTIQSVTSVTVTAIDPADTEEPAMPTGVIAQDKKHVHVNCDATASDVGRYTVAIKILTTDSRVITRRGTLVIQ